MARGKLKPSTANRLGQSLDQIEGARAELTAARAAGDDDAIVEAADRYLEARDDMGETMKAVEKESKGDKE